MTCFLCQNPFKKGEQAGIFLRPDELLHLCHNDCIFKENTMLEYTCPLCQKKYEANISGKDMIYLSGNKRVLLTSEDQDCEMCSQKLQMAMVEKRKQLREETMRP